MPQSRENVGFYLSLVVLDGGPFFIAHIFRQPNGHPFFQRHLTGFYIGPFIDLNRDLRELFPDLFLRLSIN